MGASSDAQPDEGHCVPDVMTSMSVSAPAALHKNGVDWNEERIDPDQRKVWSFHEYHAAHITAYSFQDIRDYWLLRCKPFALLDDESVCPPSGPSSKGNLEAEFTRRYKRQEESIKSVYALLAVDKDIAKQEVDDDPLDPKRVLDDLDATSEQFLPGGDDADDHEVRQDPDSKMWRYNDYHEPHPALEKLFACFGAQFARTEEEKSGDQKNVFETARNPLMDICTDQEPHFSFPSGAEEAHQDQIDAAQKNEIQLKEKRDGADVNAGCASDDENNKNASNSPRKTPRSKRKTVTNSDDSTPEPLTMQCN